MKTLLAGFENWKTSLAGVAIAVLTVYQAGGFANLSGNELLVAVGAVVVGFLTKDATKTGAPK